MSGQVDAMTKKILVNAEADAQAALESARAEAAQWLSDAREKADAEAAEMISAFEKQAREIEARARVRERAQERRAVLAAKQALIDEAVARARRRFGEQTPAQWAQLILKILQNSANTGEKPEIWVPCEMTEAINAALQGQYTVRVGDMRDGFILSFAAYDLNYEGDRLFQAQHERMEARAAACLFQGDDHAGR